MTPKKYKLVNPIEDYGKPLTEIELRPPKGKDIKKFGFPMEFSTNGSVKMDTAAAAKYIEVLGGVTPNAVDNLSAEDFQNLCLEVQVFFGGAQETS